MPWNTSAFEGWSIIGMKHYYLDTPNMRRRHLFVAMVHPSGMFVKAEGLDEDRVFEKLAQQIRHETFFRKEFYDWKRQVDFSPSGDGTTPGFFKQTEEGSEVMGNILTCVYCGMAYPEGTPPSGSQVLTDHIKECRKHPLRKAEEKIVILRAALFALIGAETVDELKQMEVAMRMAPAPDADKAVSINAIHALLATM